MITYHPCRSEQCRTPEIRHQVTFDEQNRPIRIEFEPEYLSSIASYSYKNDQDIFPEARTIQFGNYTRQEYFERDRHGNILSSNGIPRTVTRLPGGFLRIKDKGELDLGVEHEYYQHGFLVRVDSFPGEDKLNPQGTDRPSQTEYFYELYEDGAPRVKRTITSIDGKIYHGAVEQFFENGWLDRRWTSEWGSPEVPRMAYRYSNYKVDRHDNWVTRELCLISNDWDTYHFCNIEKREIVYWE